MTTRISKIIVKPNNIIGSGVTFSVYVEDPGVGEPVIVATNATDTAPEDFDSTVRDAVDVTWAANDLP